MAGSSTAPPKPRTRGAAPSTNDTSNKAKKSTETKQLEVLRAQLAAAEAKRSYTHPVSFKSVTVLAILVLVKRTQEMLDEEDEEDSESARRAKKKVFTLSIN